MGPSSLEQPLIALRTVLASGSLRRSLLAYLLFNTAEWAVWIAVLVYAYEYGGTTGAAVASVVQLVPAAMCAPFAASLGDRFSRERLLAWTYAGQAATMVLTCALLATDASAPAVLAGAALVSVSISLTRPLYLASLPAFATTAGQLTASNSVSAMVESLAVLAGPALAAGILETAGPSQVFATFAVGQVVAAFLVQRSAADARGAVDPPAGGSSVAEAIVALGELRGQSRAWLLLGYLCCTYLLVGSADVMSTVLAFDVLSLGPSGPGVLIAAMGFGGMIGAAFSILLAGRQRLGLALMGALFTAGLPFALAGLSTSVIAAALMFALTGAGKSLLEVAARTLLQRNVDPGLLSRVFGVQEALMLLALATGAAIVPTLVASLGPRAAFVGAGLLLPLFGILTWQRLRTIDAEALPLPDAFELIRHVEMFQHLPAAALEGLVRRMQPSDHAAGDVVIRQGDHGTRFYVVESGELAVSVDGLQRPPLSSGDSFGEIALVRDVPRTATVVATTPVRLWSLDRESFLEAITGHAVAATAASRVADARLAATEETSADTPGYRRERR